MKCKKYPKQNRTGWYTPVILVFRKGRQEICTEFEGRLVYIQRGYKKPGFFLTHTKKKKERKKGRS